MPILRCILILSLNSVSNKRKNWYSNHAWHPNITGTSLWQNNAFAEDYWRLALRSDVKKSALIWLCLTLPERTLTLPAFRPGLAEIWIWIVASHLVREDLFCLRNFICSCWNLMYMNKCIHTYVKYQYTSNKKVPYFGPEHFPMEGRHPTCHWNI